MNPRPEPTDDRQGPTRHTAQAQGNPTPLIDPATIAALLGRQRAAPSPHTDAELTAVITLLLDLDRDVVTVAVGHSRDTASRAAADAFVTAWRGRGEVTAVVHWPETAASWLRPAKHLTTHNPDTWVIAAAPLGFAQLARRLSQTTNWDPARTVAFASLQDSRLPTLAGPDTLHGLNGATADGGTWAVRHGWITTHSGH